MAPAAGDPQVDPSAPSRWPSTARRPGGCADPAIGKGEPSLGLPAHPRRTQEAWNPRVSHHDPHGPAGQRAPTRTPTGVGHLASVPSSAGLRHHRHRLLHRGDRAPQDSLRLVLDRAAHAAGSACWCHRPSEQTLVVQRTRELSLERPEGTTAPRFLIRDRDTKFTRAFDDVFAADGTQVITTLSRRRTPTRSPSAGCGRSGRSVWTGC